MYFVRSAAEPKPDVVVVVEAVAVGLDEADPDEVAVAVVDVRPLSTGLLLLWIAITVYQQRRRMTEVVTQHLLLIQPFRILTEVMLEIIRSQCAWSPDLRKAGLLLRYWKSCLAGFYQESDSYRTHASIQQ